MGRAGALTRPHACLRDWLACRALVAAVSRLEAEGGVRMLESDPEMADALAHAYAQPNATTHGPSTLHVATASLKRRDTYNAVCSSSAQQSDSFSQFLQVVSDSFFMGRFCFGLAQLLPGRAHRANVSGLIHEGSCFATLALLSVAEMNIIILTDIIEDPPRAQVHQVLSSGRKRPPVGRTTINITCCLLAYVDAKAPPGSGANASSPNPLSAMQYKSLSCDFGLREFVANNLFDLPAFPLMSFKVHNNSPKRLKPSALHMLAKELACKQRQMSKQTTA